MNLSRRNNKINDNYYNHCDCYDSSVVVSFTALSQNNICFILLTIFFPLKNSVPVSVNTIVSSII